MINEIWETIQRDLAVATYKVGKWLGIASVIVIGAVIIYG